jgi:hypothetical protein
MTDTAPSSPSNPPPPDGFTETPDVPVSPAVAEQAVTTEPAPTAQAPVAPVEPEATVPTPAAQTATTEALANAGVDQAAPAPAGTEAAGDGEPVSDTPAPVPAAPAVPVEAPTADPGTITHVIPTGRFSDTRERDAALATGERGIVREGNTNPVANEIAKAELALSTLENQHGLLREAIGALKLLLQAVA